MNNNINYFDWNEISEIVKNMSQNIKKDYNPEIIISVVRGGMIPGVILSHALNIRKVENIKSIETISDEINAIKQEPIVDENINLSEIRGKKVLIIDDILGSGATIRKIKEEVKKWKPEELRTAICVVNEQNWEKSNRSNYNAEIEYIGKAVRGWVVFPWEMQRKE